MTFEPSWVRYFRDKTSAPGVNDDIDQGYEITDVWADITNSKLYMCLDNASGAADWNQIDSLGTTDHGGLGGLGDDDHTQYIKDTEFTQDSSVLVGTGAGTFVEETGATLRNSIGSGDFLVMQIFS